MLRFGQTAVSLFVLGTCFLMGCGDTTAGPAGPPGRDGTNGMDGMPGANDPVINAISPRTVYLDRQTTVTIGGNDTAWADTVTVDFGPGITSKIVSVSPALLVVDLTIDETAAVGPREVSVDNGAAGKITLKNAFEVMPPLSLGTVQGTLAQGSIFVARLIQNDLTTPFDPSSKGKNVSMESGSGVGMSIEEVQSYTLDFTGTVDVDTSAGDIDFRVKSGKGADQVASFAPKVGAIAARTATPLMEGTQSPGSVASAFESSLYSFAPGPHKLVNVEVSATDPNALADMVLLPESGKFADIVSFAPTGRLLTVTDKPIYIIYWDPSGASGYPYDIKITTQDSDDLEPNDTCATAQTIANGPSALRHLSLKDKVDEDWFVINAAAADVGKVVHATTKPGDTKTDTFVEVFTGSCANLVPLGSPSIDNNYHEDLASAPIKAAGKVYVKVSNSPSSSFGGTYYDMDVDLLRSEAEPNDMCTQGNAITTLPADLSFATIGSATDVDWYTVTVTAADVGKLLTIATTAGDDNTDTYIEAYSGSCASPTLLGTSKDTDYHETLKVGPIMAAGTYRVRISNSPTYPYGGSKYNVSFSMVLPDDVEPNNTCMQAQQGGALGMPFGPLYLPNQADEDWLVYPVSAADVGKSVHVVTSPGEDNTDTVVEVFEGMCPSLTSLGGPSTDIFYHEDWVSSPMTQPGLVYVKVSYSPGAYVNSAYMLNVEFQ